MLPWCNVLLEPERTLLGLSFQESLSRYQRIKRVMAWGLAQIHAERFYETYGSQAYESSSAQVKALLAFASQNERRAALSSTGAKLSPDQRTVLEAMGWFLEQIRGERTLFRETDVPVKLKEGLRLSANAGWVITDGDHYQLKSNANLQVAVRRQLERLSRNFFQPIPLMKFATVIQDTAKSLRPIAILITKTKSPLPLTPEYPSFARRT